MTQDSGGIKRTHRPAHLTLQPIRIVGGREMAFPINFSSNVHFKSYFYTFLVYRINRQSVKIMCIFSSNT